MAEIEPGRPTGASIDTQPVLAGAGGGAAGVAPPSSRAGVARWGVALLALALMVGVVAAAAVFLAAGGGASSVESWIPKGTVAYLEVRGDLPGDQRANAANLLAKFPGFADQSTIDSKVDEALGRLLEPEGISWTTDVKPWLGGEVGVAVTSAALDAAGSMAGVVAQDAAGTATPGLGATFDDGAVLLVAVKDGSAATAWIAKQIGGTPSTETYAGGDLSIIAGPGNSSMAYAVRDGILVAGPEKTVKAALDTAGASSVASSDAFKAAKSSAPDAYLGFGFMDLEAVMDAALAAGGGTADLPKACLDAALAAVPGWASGSARAEADALVFTSTYPSVGEASATKAGPNAAASHLPASTIAVVGVRDLGPSIVGGLEALKKSLACDPSTAAVVDQVEQALAAAGGADALVGWAGDAAVAVTADGAEIGGGLAAIAKDETAAKKAFDQVQALVVLGGAGSGLATRQEAYGSGTLLLVTLPSSVTGMDVPEIAVTLQDGVFAIGTTGFVKAVVDTAADASLATSPVYERAIDAAGGPGVSDVFVDIAGLRAVVEKMLPASEKATYDTEVKPFLAPLEAFAAVAEAPGSTTTSRSVITFTK